jgi:hemolysin D
MQLPKRIQRFPPSEISWAAVSIERMSHPIWAVSFLFVVTSVLVIGVGFSLIARIPLLVQGKGHFTSLTPPVPIRAAAKMTVAKVYVVENQQVKKGQPLVSSVESVSPGDVAILKAYNKELTTLEKMNLKECGDPCLRRLRAQSSAYLNLRLQGEAVGVVGPVQDQVRELILALEERKLLSQLTADARAQVLIDTRKLNEIKKRHAETILAKEVESLTVDLEINRTKIKEKYQKSDERIGGAGEQLTAKLTDLSNRIGYLGQQYAVYSPFDGTVTSLNLKGEGEVLQAGQDLMTLIPRGTPLIAEIELDNKDIADVLPGLEGEIVIDSLPEYEYGTVHGKVIEISRKEVDSSIERRLATLTASTFVARISLQSQALSRDGIVTPYALGMSVQGRIAVRHETIFHVVMRSLFRMKDDFQAKSRI